METGVQAHAATVVAVLSTCGWLLAEVGVCAHSSRNHGGRGGALPTQHVVGFRTRLRIRFRRVRLRSPGTHADPTGASGMAASLGNIYLTVLRVIVMASSAALLCSLAAPFSPWIHGDTYCARAPRHGTRGSPGATPDPAQDQDAAAAPDAAVRRRRPPRVAAQAQPRGRRGEVGRAQGQTGQSGVVSLEPAFHGQHQEQPCPRVLVRQEE